MVGSAVVIKLGSESRGELMKRRTSIPLWVFSSSDLPNELPLSYDRFNLNRRRRTPFIFCTSASSHVRPSSWRFREWAFCPTRSGTNPL